MGTKWGVIHNQTKEEIIYTLHSTEMSPLEQTIKTSMEGGITIDAAKMEAGLGNTCFDFRGQSRL